jgi:hypothetical protein
MEQDGPFGPTLHAWFTAARHAPDHHRVSIIWPNPSFDLLALLNGPNNYLVMASA